MAPSGSIPDYFPEKWKDDDFMTGAMAMLKNREVNPLDYDKKTKFWSELIDKSCEAEKTATFSVDTLKKRFRRGDRVPACMPQIVEFMTNRADAMPLSAWRDNHSSWLGWGVSKLGSTASWLWGSGDSVVANNEQYVHIPSLKRQAGRVLEFFRRELEMDFDGSADIVGYADMYDRCAHIAGTLTNFELVLEELIEQGEISMGSSRGDKIVKFRDTRSTGPASFSESDASVHDIRRTMGTLEKKISALERQISKLDAECRTAIRAGEKTKAAGILRKKKAAEKELQEKDGQIQRLLTMLHQIGSSKHNKDVIDAYKAGSTAFKSTLARHGLSPDKIDETMDEVMNATEEFRDIEEALAQPIAGIHDATRDAELEGELEELLSAEKKEKEREKTVSGSPLKLPEVPGGALGLPASAAEIDYTQLEKRLKRLQQL